tara:strand:+ start:913 stop:1110 length:198 start_codon:yes stop_codon:yes gene_type:complete
VLFFISKIIERNYSEDPSPIKYIFRDSIIVYLSSALTLYGFEQYKTFLLPKEGLEPIVLTDNPPF